jgi:hypothetical protein
MPDHPTRKDTWALWVRVEDVGAPGRPMRDLGVWDKKEGGETDSEEFKYNPGAMAGSVSLGGRKLIGNVTVSRLYRLLRDHATVYTMLNNGAGRAKAKLMQQPLDLDGVPFGNPLVYDGTLKRVTPPDVDSEDSGPAMVEIEITIEGEPFVG